MLKSLVFRKNKWYSSKLQKTLILRPQTPAILQWQNNHVKHGNSTTWHTLMLWNSMEIKSIKFKHALHLYRLSAWVEMQTIQFKYVQWMKRCKNRDWIQSKSLWLSFFKFLIHFYYLIGLSDLKGTVFNLHSV